MTVFDQRVLLLVVVIQLPAPCRVVGDVFPTETLAMVEASYLSPLSAALR